MHPCKAAVSLSLWLAECTHKLFVCIPICTAHRYLVNGLSGSQFTHKCTWSHKTLSKSGVSYTTLRPALVLKLLRCISRCSVCSLVIRGDKTKHILGFAVETFHVVKCACLCSEQFKEHIMVQAPEWMHAWEVHPSAVASPAPMPIGIRLCLDFQFPFCKWFIYSTRSYPAVELCTPEPSRQLKAAGTHNVT